MASISIPVTSKANVLSGSSPCVSARFTPSAPSAPRLPEAGLARQRVTSRSCISGGLVLTPVLGLGARHGYLVAVSAVIRAGLIRVIVRRSFDHHRRMLVSEIALHARLLVHFPFGPRGSTVSGRHTKVGDWAPFDSRNLR